MPAAKTVSELVGGESPPSIPVDILEAKSTEILIEKNKDGKYIILVRVDNVRVLMISASDVIITDLLGRIGSQDDMGRPGNGRPVRPI